MVGRASRVEIGRNSTTIVGGAADARNLQARLAAIRADIAAARYLAYDREQHELRLARLSGAIATVRIGAPDGFGVAFLAKRLGELTTQHRELTIQLVPVPRSFSLSRREADIAITVERPSEGRLVAGKLVDYSLGLFASQAYAERHGLPRTAAELAQHTLIGYVPDLIVSPSLDYAEFSPDWRSAFAISSALGQAEAVRAGAGIGILHTFIARSMPDLVPVEAVQPIRRAYWLVYHESVRPLRRVQAVADFIAKAVEKERALFL